MKKMLISFCIAIFITGCAGGRYAKNSSMGFNATEISAFKMDGRITQFPFLKIFLRKPINKVFYRYDGPKYNMSGYQRKLIREFGIDSRHLGEVHDNDSGSCLKFFHRDNLYFVSYVNAAYSGKQQWVAAVHEEMHVASWLNISEVYENIHKRFRRLGYDVNLYALDPEKQACAAQLLIIWENNYSIGEIFPNRPPFMLVVTERIINQRKRLSNN